MIARTLALGALLIAAAGSAADAPLSAQNHTVRLTVTARQWRDTYGENHAAAGRTYLILDAQWTNVIDSAFAASRNLPVEAKNDDLAESLALVVDGHDSFPLTLREAPTANLDTNDADIVGHSGGSTDAAYLRKVVGLQNAAGRRALAYFDLEKPGSSSRGDLVFEAPAAEGHTLELRFHDPTGGDFALPLAGKSAAPGAESAAEDPPGRQRNDIFALAAHLSANPARGLPPAPPDRRYLTVEFQARSLVKVEDQFPAYDPSHAQGETFWRPDPAGWTGFSDDLFVIADGSLPCGLDPATILPGDLEFPATGWGTLQLVFLVPTSAKALELECFFADYTIPGHEGTVSPPPMHFRLNGTATGATLPDKSEKTVADGTMEFRVAAHHLVASFAGEPAAEGERFLLVDFAVQNHGPDVGRFTVAEQCVWFNHGDETVPDDISARGPQAPAASFALASGETRRFQVAWRVPATAKKFEMGLKGNQVAEKFTLAAP
ncbi:MAG TPA: hypothetical protein VGM73_11130 [Candidatus Didemnitutus sp.]|jgi:hypothetical protein